jgi:hypothetical protein
VLERADLRTVHGFSLWCLCSELEQQVHYHIDYAEVVRHLTGTTTPPLFGGVLHCSDFADGAMSGGDFAANTRGLDHYREWGFKAKLARAARDGEREERGASGDGTMQGEGRREGSGADFCELRAVEAEPGWEFVSYRTNRLVLMDGDLPHMSTPVLALPEGKRRVILGINVFGHNVGRQAEQFPDHAERSNRVVNMLQALGAASGAAGRAQLMRAMMSRVKAKAKAPPPSVRAPPAPPRA